MTIGNQFGSGNGDQVFEREVVERFAARSVSCLSFSASRSMLTMVENQQVPRARNEVDESRDDAPGRLRTMEV